MRGGLPHMTRVALKTRSAEAGISHQIHDDVPFQCPVQDERGRGLRPVDDKVSCQDVMFGVVVLNAVDAWSNEVDRGHVSS